ncbi:MAG: hypothetical protein P4M01_02830 [Acidobacteriota bacterium]|nr:hypothetical protein [Acidobacteriota bacterium]
MSRGLNKYHILFLDDKRTWLDNFQQQHGDEYDLTLVASGREFDLRLERMVAEGHPPDVVLIDLYHPKYPDDPARQAELTTAGDAAIQDLEAAIQKARGPILAAWDPYGVEILERARKFLDSRGHGDIPLVIYTQQGLTIASNEELKRVSQLRGEWLIKNKSNADYESHRLNEMISLRERQKDNYRRVYQNTSWMIAALLLVTLVGLAYFHHKTMDLVLSIGLSAVLVAVQPFIAKLSSEK